MPQTFTTYYIGALAIAGIPGLAGFFSKDEILHAAAGSGHWVLWLIGLITAGMTAFYMWRLMYMTFYGKSRVAPEVAALYDALEQQRGVVPYMFKTLAHTPALALGIAGFLKALLGDGALPGWYKELVATRVALLVDCDY